MKKRVFTFFLALTMCLALLPKAALAAGQNFTIEGGELIKYNGPGGNVTIPSSVTSIGMKAFADCTGLTAVTIPDSVTYIGMDAFCGCTGLTAVTIPDSVTFIGALAFYGCNDLKDIYYSGTEAQWEAIKSDEPGDFRNDLKNAAIHFNSTGPEMSAAPTNDKLSVDGKDATPAAYKINGANYFKLRDVVMLLQDSEAQFSIDYDGEKNAIMITTGQPYQPIGGELGTAPTAAATAAASNDTVYINGVKVELTAYKIDSANYYGIRELGKALGFNVGWTQERGMFIESDKPYTDAD